MDGRDLQSLRRLEIGQQRGEPLGKHRLAGTRWARQEQVMSASGRDLECQPPFVLPDHIAQVRDHNVLGHHCPVDDDHRWLLATADGLVSRHQLTEVARGDDRDARNECSFGRVRGRNHDLGHAQTGRRQHHGQHASHRAD